MSCACAKTLSPHPLLSSPVQPASLTSLVCHCFCYPFSPRVTHHQSGATKFACYAVEQTRVTANTNEASQWLWLLQAGYELLRLTLLRFPSSLALLLTHVVITGMSVCRGTSWLSCEWRGFTTWGTSESKEVCRLNPNNANLESVWSSAFALPHTIPEGNLIHLVNGSVIRISAHITFRLLHLHHWPHSNFKQGLILRNSFHFCFVSMVSIIYLPHVI